MMMISTFFDCMRYEYEFEQHELFSFVLLHYYFLCVLLFFLMFKFLKTSKKKMKSEMYQLSLIFFFFNLLSYRLPDEHYFHHSIQRNGTVL